MAGKNLGRGSDVQVFLENFDEQSPSQQSMRGERRYTRNPSTDQKSRRRQQQRTAAEEEPMTTDTGHSRENVRARLLAEAAQASTDAEATRLVAEAEKLRTEGVLEHEASRSWDAASTEVRDTLTPAPVHELHTASTDWIAETDVSGGEQMRQAMIATAQNWYASLHPMVLADSEEFRIQAEGMGRRESGGFGVAADDANRTFLTTAATLRQRDLNRGMVVEAQVVGEPGAEGMGAADVLGQNPPVDGYNGLPGAETDSNRAPAFQDMSGGPTPNPQVDSGQGDPGMAGEARTPSPDPYKAASRTAAGGQMPHVAEGKEMPEFLKKKIDNESDGDPDAPDPKEKKEGSVRHQALRGHVATCPSCDGFGGVAQTDHGRSIIAHLQRQGYSGLHQIEEIADPKDEPSQTPLPTDPAFPMEQGGWNPANGPQTDIAQAEQQISQRSQGQPGMNSVTRQSSRVEALAAQAAEEARRAVYAAHRPKTVWDMFATGAAAETPPAQVGAYYDASGWLGDMGQTPPSPGQQDGGNPGPASNLGWTDPVYGQGGDQPPGPRKPFGADEAADETNQPSSWSPGQQTQMDMGGRGTSLPNSDAPGFPDNGGGYGNQAGNQFQNGNGNSKQSKFDSDPEVQQARAFLASGNRPASEVSRARQFLAKKASAYGVRV